MSPARAALSALWLLLTAAACTERPPAPDQAGVVGGTVSYHERIALTNEAVLVVTLEDVSRQDVAARVIASQRIADPGQVPIRFELEYPRHAIDPRMSYAVRALITDRGRLLFTTETLAPVLTHGAGNKVHLLLVQVEGTGVNPVKAH